MNVGADDLRQLVREGKLSAVEAPPTTREPAARADRDRPPPHPARSIRTRAAR